MKAPLVAAVALLLAACSTDIQDIGQAPALTPVGSGIRAGAASSSLAGVTAFAARDEGWTGGSADFFRDARARKEGDIITVRIAINDQATLNNTSNRSRKSNAAGDLGLNYSLLGAVGADVKGAGKVNSSTSSAGQGSTARSEKIDLAIAAVVTSVLPNGYLVVEGSQEILVNFEQRTLHVAGIIHPTDITPENSISYEKIAEARISYGGKGRLTEVQQPGWTQQIWDRISPF
ncbi:MAG: flagellar basal body L-ring protein FlgH [Rhizobiales bacterium]|nr:flagellar basal body L-ring protein FlgH [Hyphomicrobiales bacterium]MBI3672096.1 flagellar basal body L-ring protein FlgH [Hyphomicrobiales bacterium]